MKRLMAGALILLFLLAWPPVSAPALSAVGQTSDVTVMVYIDGADLEEDSGSASADIDEMLSADLSDRVSVILCTGGSKTWQNSAIRPDTNQYFRIQDGRLILLKDAGMKNMTNPSTLTEFVRFCAENYPARRNILILWSHGGGSLYGFGLDNRFPAFHMMPVNDLGDALDQTGVHFDFIGFDSCLMATAETAVSLAGCADYMIASEEMEPSIGWYYTGWLSRLSAQPDIDTETLGRSIINEFMEKGLANDPQDTLTLSMIDLDRFQDVVLPCLWAFAADTARLLNDGSFGAVSHARSDARAFGEVDEYDQVDLMDFAAHVGTDSAEALMEALYSAIVYSRATRNMDGSSGIAIYFPFKQANMLNGMLKTYGSLGWDQRYLSLISSFASLQRAGQQRVAEASAETPDAYDWYDASFVDEQSGYLINTRLDGEELLVRLKNDAYYALSLTDEAWDLVTKIQLQVYLDDDEGYIELGSDDEFQFDDDGDLMMDYDGTWVSLNGQTVAYYAEDFVSDGDYYCYTGRVPILFRDRLAFLILSWDSKHEGGYVRGVRPTAEHNAAARGLIRLREGDVIQPLCDYYDYEGEYVDTYRFGEPITFDHNLKVTYEDVGYEKSAFCYMLSDIYDNHYWTEYIYVS